MVDCNRPARAATGDGLDRRFCRSHADHHAAHGSPYKGSYGGKTLAPHRKAAMAWLEANADTMFVVNAAQRIRGLYERAGPLIPAYRLRGLTAAERARAAWARLRKADIHPHRVIAAQFAVEEAIRHDPQAVLKTEYRRVQVAKVVHRMASGTHRVWRGARYDGADIELRVYPRPRGMILRHLGKDVEEATEHLSDGRLGPFTSVLSAGTPGSG